MKKQLAVGSDFLAVGISVARCVGDLWSARGKVCRVSIWVLALAYPVLAAHAQPTTETFEEPGEHPIDVPANVCEITVNASGAQGGAGGGNPDPGGEPGPGGLGAAATGALVQVSPGEELLVVVGGAGENGTLGDAGAGGFNGGGAGGDGTGKTPLGGGGGGGGASEVRRGDDTLVIAGAGGGGGGATNGGAGGDSGEAGTDGGDGGQAGSGGQGGTGEQGGSGGTGTDQDGGGGTAGNGGAGGSGSQAGGGGGAGAFGGGGGGGMVIGSGPGGGGGGGSSFGPAGTVFQTRVREGNGLVEITYEPDPVGCAEADLTINKEATVNADGTAAFSLAVENLDPDDATGVVVTDELPACTTYISDDCGGTNVPPWTWPVGPLAPGNSVSCTLTVDASGCAGEGEETNVATVAGDQEDPDEDNNSAEATFEIAGEEPDEADLSIALAATVVGNPTAELELTAGNAGPDAATGVEVALELPECTAFESDTCDGTPTDGEWTWAVGALAADATTACTVTVDILDCEPPPTFTATIAGAPTDPDPANNTAELQLEVEPVPALPMVALVLLAAALSVVTLHKLRRDRGRSSEQKRG